MRLETATRISYGTLGLILGAALAILIALKAGFLVSKGAAEQMVHGALLKARVAICVAQFRSALRYQDRLKEMKALSFMQRDDFIARGAWDRMPGEDKASEGVNRLCGDRLTDLPPEQPASH
jgi:hypothetical protein